MAEDQSIPTPHDSSLQPTEALPVAPTVLDYQNPLTNSSMTRLRRLPTVFEANLAKAALENQGINVELAGQTRQAGIGPAGALSDGVDVLVPAAEIDSARAILDAIDSRRAKSQAAKLQRLHCPRCGNTDSSPAGKHRARMGLFLLAAGFLGIPVFLFKILPPFTGLLCAGLICAGFYFLSSESNRRTCGKCGNAWTPPEEDEVDEDEEPQEPDEGNAKESEGERS